MSRWWWRAELARLLGDEWVRDYPLDRPNRGPGGYTAPPRTPTYVDHDSLIRRVDLQTSNAQVYTFVAAGDRIPFELAHLPIITCVSGSAVARGSAGASRTAMATTRRADTEAEADSDADVVDAQAEADTTRRRTNTSSSSEV